MYSCRTCGKFSDKRYCEEHEPPKRVNRAPRKSFRQRGYGSEFTRNRKRLLKLHPECIVCGKPATVANHIIDKVNGGSDKLENLEPMCTSCHNKHTARTRPAGWNKR